MKASTAKFLKVKCSNCKNEQIIFERASLRVACLVCKEILAQPRGGRAQMLVQPSEQFE